MISIVVQNLLRPNNWTTLLQSVICSFITINMGAAINTLLCTKSTVGNSPQAIHNLFLFHKNNSATIFFEYIYTFLNIFLSIYMCVCVCLSMACFLCYNGKKLAHDQVIVDNHKKYRLPPALHFKRFIFHLTLCLHGYIFEKKSVELNHNNLFWDSKTWGPWLISWAPGAPSFRGWLGT